MITHNWAHANKDHFWPPHPTPPMSHSYAFCTCVTKRLSPPPNICVTSFALLWQHKGVSKCMSLSSMSVIVRKNPNLHDVIYELSHKWQANGSQNELHITDEISILPDGCHSFWIIGNLGTICWTFYINHWRAIQVSCYS